MASPILSIDHLSVKAYGKQLLTDISLEIYPGEIIAIMGPNGAGKSSLSRVLAGHPAYEVVSGNIFFQQENITNVPPEVRVAKGLFLSFQNPLEIAGVSTLSFLRAIHKAVQTARNEIVLGSAEFEAYVAERFREIHLSEEMMRRDINVGFSGGEKKRNEIIQMQVINPILSFLDEIDSGLDVDGLRVVAECIKKFLTPEKAAIIVTHYTNLLSYIRPHRVYILVGGKIMQSGDFALAQKLEQKGYQDFLPMV